MIKTMDTNKLFAYTWCPVADETGNAPLGGIETLVEFKLQPIHGGTRLQIIESGFSAIPAEKQRNSDLMHCARIRVAGIFRSRISQPM